MFVLVGLVCLLSSARAEEAWVKADVALVRWLDSTVVTTSLTTGDKVDVLVHDGGKVRVRKGTDFGWMDAAGLSDTVVAKPEPADLFALPGAAELPAIPSPTPATPPPAP